MGHPWLEEVLKQAADSEKTRLSQQADLPVRLCAAVLSKRTVIAITGDDALGFANDLTTNDITRAESESDEGGAQTTAFLTAQGSMRQLCLAVRTQHGLLLECDRACLDSFSETLWKARLGRAVAFRWLKETQVVSLFPESSQQAARAESPMEKLAKNFAKNLVASSSNPFSLHEDSSHGDSSSGDSSHGDSSAAGQQGQEEKKEKKKNEEERLFLDPRKPLSAMRLWYDRSKDLEQAVDLPWDWVEEAAYESYRLSLAVVERAEEWEHASQKHALPFAFGLDALGAMDWQKACYVGQEISARLKYRARVAKKHALPVRLTGKGGVVQAGDKVLNGTKEEREKETLCGEVLYSVATEQQTILLVLFDVAALRLARREEEALPVGEKITVLCASGERRQGELLLPRWLEGLWGGVKK